MKTLSQVDFRATLDELHAHYDYIRTLIRDGSADFTVEQLFCMLDGSLVAINEMFSRARC